MINAVAKTFKYVECLHTFYSIGLFSPLPVTPPTSAMKQTLQYRSRIPTQKKCKASTGTNYAKEAPWNERLKGCGHSVTDSREKAMRITASEKKQIEPCSGPSNEVTLYKRKQTVANPNDVKDLDEVMVNFQFKGSPMYLSLIHI